MAFLEIGALTVEVQHGAEQMAREELGDVERASDGTLRSTVRGYKRGWRCSTGPLTRADAEDLEDEIDLGPVAVEGELLWAAAPFDAIVKITAATPVPDIDDVSGAQWVLALEIREV